MPDPGESDFAARSLARYDEFEAEQEQIAADYDACLKAAADVERYWDSASQPGAGRFWAEQLGVPTEGQLRERRDELLDQAKDKLERDLRLLDRERVTVEPEPVAAVSATRGAKSRWRRADLETILVTQPGVSARQLAAGGDLVERIRHQRISELRRRGDVREEGGRLHLPEGTTADGGWVILPKLG